DKSPILYILVITQNLINPFNFFSLVIAHPSYNRSMKDLGRQLFDRHHFLYFFSSNPFNLVSTPISGKYLISIAYVRFINRLEGENNEYLSDHGNFWNA
ncbi:MAG: hypothetical protein ACXACR_12515, partial [Candidatus Hodarchaeales archaeon]